MVMIENLDTHTSIETKSKREVIYDLVNSVIKGGTTQNCDDIIIVALHMYDDMVASGIIQEY